MIGSYDYFHFLGRPRSEGGGFVPSWLSFTVVGTFLLGAVASVSVEAIVRSFLQGIARFDRSRRARRANELSYREFGVDPETMYFFAIRTWNEGRPLLPEYIGRTDQVEMASRSAQNWIDPVRFQPYLERARARGGSPCPTMVSFQIDDWESKATRTFKMRVARAHYSDYMAVRDYFMDPANAAELDVVCQRLKTGDFLDVLAAAPISNIVINVTVTSATGQVLILQRSNRVATYQRAWQTGPHETMNWVDFEANGANPETCLEMARRALREEVGLVDADYRGRIVFSWFGIYVRDVSFYFYAHVKSNLTPREIELKLRQAEGADETRTVAWLPFTKRAFADIIGTWNGLPASSMRGRADSNGRDWVPHTTVSLLELWRCRHLIESD